MRKVERVHVVFKTHLDIGFTDLAERVVDRYMRLFIPQALTLAEQLEAEGGADRFLWTTGSWLIHEYFNRADTDHARMEKAIHKGHIAWHGLPFTTHTELIDPSLFAYGLSIASRLDRQFGRKTIAAKMTDVPGHTRGIVPLMAEQGIRYLHIGVNPASKVPDVPELFVWQGADGSRLLVNYAKEYGAALELDDFHEVLVFAHTGDNLGPPSCERIRADFARLRERYPGAVIQASTMDAFARRLLEHEDRLPVVREEIGDTWIHGTGSDPRKVAIYRALSRLRRKWLAEGRLDPESKAHDALSDNLLLTAEHTWGLDEKTHLSDYMNYARRDFERARAADFVGSDAVPAKYRHFGAFAMLNDHHAEDHAVACVDESANEEPKRGSFRSMEQSWEEQRSYADRAVAALPPSLGEEARAALAALAPTTAIPEGAADIRPGVRYTLGAFTVCFGADGSLIELTDRRGKHWADDRHRLGAFRYESFGEQAYSAWLEQYLEHRRQTQAWSEADFGKPGLEFADPKPVHRRYSPSLVRMARQSEAGLERIFVKLAMPEETVRLMGAPAEVLLEYRLARSDDEVEVDVNWTGKPANRQPEALWLSFAPKVDNPNLWKLDKLGDRISPLEVVKGGNRSLHAVDSGLYYEGADGTAVVRTLDAPLVAPGEPKLLQHTNAFAPLEGGFHFLLYNNTWGTNFPMWYEDDGRFRFKLILSSYAKMKMS
ncbi:DUF5054 domain-containing protein [Cohnella sp. REN36]|uniref:DUF5054 domain-containing protein n=1 Tax=Cohnella sp. REN36 TaxID=2887347 RepID=UPI001D134B53|nr:DUF5054 domain-containing protein [Cohnella sp. REN36]MCC3373541.1 DUF5054 domain-containing protein [Cohnella sp. REN36]